jgi:hypothetical protein
MYIKHSDIGFPKGFCVFMKTAKFFNLAFEEN